MPRKSKYTPEEQKRRRIWKRLQAVDYTPTAARLIGDILQAMANCSPELREARLRVFSEIANER